MEKILEFECKDCAIQVAMIIIAPPVDTKAIHNKMNELFFNCPRCFCTMEKLEVGNLQEYLEETF